MRVNKAYDAFYLRKWHKGGASWRVAAYQQAPFWGALRDLPPEVAFYTNKWVVVDFYTGHPTRPLLHPPPVEEVRGTCAVYVLLGNTRLDRQLAALVEDFRRAGFPLWGQWEMATVFVPPGSTCLR